MVKANADTRNPQGDDRSDKNRETDHSKQPLFNGGSHEPEASMKLFASLRIVLGTDADIRKKPLSPDEKILLLRNVIEMIRHVPGVFALGAKQFSDIMKPFNGRSLDCEMVFRTQKKLSNFSQMTRVIGLIDDSPGARGSRTDCTIRYHDKESVGHKKHVCTRHLLFLDAGGNIINLCLFTRYEKNAESFPHKVVVDMADDKCLLALLKHAPHMVDHILYQLYLKAETAARNTYLRANAIRTAGDNLGNIIALLRALETASMPPDRNLALMA